jgi:NADPH2:quinone reductase
MKAIRFDRTGGPEALCFEDIELPPPGPGQARIRHTAIGVNFIDAYHRSGLYPIPLPSGPAAKPPAWSNLWAPA